MPVPAVSARPPRPPPPRARHAPSRRSPTAARCSAHCPPVILQGWLPAPRGSTRPSARATDRHLHPRRHRRATTSRRRGGGVAPAPTGSAPRARTGEPGPRAWIIRLTSTHFDHADPPIARCRHAHCRAPRTRAARSTLRHAHAGTPRTAHTRAAPCAAHRAAFLARRLPLARVRGYPTRTRARSARSGPIRPARALAISFQHSTDGTSPQRASEPSLRSTLSPPLDVFPPWHRSSTRDRRASPCSSRAKRDLTINTPARAALQIA